MLKNWSRLLKFILINVGNFLTFVGNCLLSTSNFIPTFAWKLRLEEKNFVPAASRLASVFVCLVYMSVLHDMVTLSAYYSTVGERSVADKRCKRFSACAVLVFSLQKSHTFSVTFTNYQGRGV